MNHNLAELCTDVRQKAWPELAPLDIVPGLLTDTGSSIETFHDDNRWIIGVNLTTFEDADVSVLEGAVCHGFGHVYKDSRRNWMKMKAFNLGYRFFDWVKRREEIDIDFSCCIRGYSSELLAYTRFMTEKGFKLNGMSEDHIIWAIDNFMAKGKYPALHKEYSKP